MNADDFPDLQAGKADAFPCKEETHVIIGCAFEVLNELGHGLIEKLYENSLVVDLKRRSVAFDQQRRFEVLYKSEYVGEFIPDLIAFGKVVVDAKCIDRITDHDAELPPHHQTSRRPDPKLQARQAGVGKNCFNNRRWTQMNADRKQQIRPLKPQESRESERVFRHGGFAAAKNLRSSASICG